MDINKETARIEKETGKFVASWLVDENGIKAVELMPYGPGDLILNVWNCCVRLARIVKSGDNGYTFIDALSPAAYEREDAQDWLIEALDASGGFINRSGHYPIKIPIPDWLEIEIALTTLSR